MKNIKLIDLNKNIERGAILRCKGKYPYEDYVDFMVIEQQKQYSLLVASGYKAGLTFVHLPQESIPKDNEGYAIDIEWLKLNWNKWGYIDCPIDEVHIIYKDPPNHFYDS
ncbi:Imm45 family immunity protein [Lysinibacillus sp. FJAT-14745]|uniref:Imm45 family immunity protein n=1 Tax=Lysinibacillus sp. FJAT-14745 TaxID=1704289 RepID=UPI0006ABE3EA|nr:Imm45 family immunity protein [Lysinibacillus sp. FJAT-14745]